MKFTSYKKSSPSLNGISNRGMGSAGIAFDRLAIKHGVPLSTIYNLNIGQNDEWHHVRRIVKGDRTGSVVAVEFGTEEEFIEMILDTNMKYKLTPKIRIELLTRSVDSFYN